MKVINLHQIRIERRSLYTDFSASSKRENFWGVVVCELCRSTRDSDGDAFGFVKINGLKKFRRIIKGQSEVFFERLSGNALEVSAASEWRCRDDTITDDVSGYPVSV